MVIDGYGRVGGTVNLLEEDIRSCQRGVGWAERRRHQRGRRQWW
jgi:hypothetical protein